MVLLVNIQVFQRPLDEAELIITIKNDKVAFEGQVFRLPAEQSGAEGVKSAQREAASSSAQQLGYSGLHLAGSFVGKSDRKNAVGIQPQPINQVSNPPGEHARLPGAWASKHQHWSSIYSDRLFLLWVEPRENIHIGRIVQVRKSAVNQKDRG
jgi:hypothetical protein